MPRTQNIATTAAFIFAFSLPVVFMLLGAYDVAFAIMLAFVCLSVMVIVHTVEEGTSPSGLGRVCLNLMFGVPLFLVSVLAVARHGQNERSDGEQRAGRSEDALCAVASTVFIACMLTMWLGPLVSRNKAMHGIHVGQSMVFPQPRLDKRHKSDLGGEAPSFALSTLTSNYIRVNPVSMSGDCKPSGFSDDTVDLLSFGDLVAKGFDLVVVGKATVPERRWLVRGSFDLSNPGCQVEALVYPYGMALMAAITRDMPAVVASYARAEAQVRLLHEQTLDRERVEAASARASGNGAGTP